MIERWLDDRPYELLVEQDGADETACIIKISESSLPEWGVVIGEIAHNLRSALDQVVYEMTAGNKGKPLGGSEFPIFIDGLKFRNAKRGGGRYKIRGLTQAAQDLVERLQPFQQADPHLHRLWVLHELSNVDKHRLLHRAGLVSGASKLKLSADAHVGVQILEVRQDGPVEDGTKLAQWRVGLPPGQSGSVTLEGDISYEVAFDPAGPARGAPVVPALDVLGRYVLAVVEEFAKLV